MEITKIETSLGRFKITSFLKKGLFKNSEMNWDSALNEAGKIEDGGWRLPTLEECITIHNETEAFDDLKGKWVLWCQDQYSENTDCAYIFDQGNILTGFWNKKDKWNAIAIKQL